MDIQRLTEIVNSPSNITADDISELENLSIQYPYAQFLHVLLAKIANDHENEQKDRSINTAAIYASDRAVLKKVVTDPTFQATLPPDAFLQYVKPQKAEPELADVSGPVEPEVEPAEEPAGQDHDRLDSDALFEEVMKNLETLRALRKQYEFLEQQENARTQDVENDQLEQGQSEAAQTPENPSLEETGISKDENSETNRELGLDIGLEASTTIDIIEADQTYPDQQEEHAPDQADNDVRKYQDDLISRFIEKDPGIKANHGEAENPGNQDAQDLSARSTSLNENLVSENLANLFIRQGKTAKAIDIYKKLIWKFPQKKAYFAAQIEDLKKN